VRGQHVIWDYLSQGGHEHWGELSKGTVVQGRFKVVSLGYVLYKYQGSLTAWLRFI
jgi:carbonic anhydrase